MSYQERTPEDDRFDEIIKMEGLNIQSFHQDPPIDLFPNAQYYPQFFNQNLVNPNRVLKQFLNDPQSNIRVFYLQLLRLAFQVSTDSGYNHICLQNFKKIVFHPEFEILFTPDSEAQREIYNDFQFKKLFAEFISLLITASESEPPSIEQAIDQFPIIDIVLIHIIRSLLVSFNIKVAFDEKISTDLLFKELSSVLQLSLTSYGNCWKFEESDMFCYEENENELYMAFIADDYYSQETNNLQTIESVQNQERYIEDSFRSGNSGKNIIPASITEPAQEYEDQGLREGEKDHWSDELYHHGTNTFGDVKMRLSDNEPPANIPVPVAQPVPNQGNYLTVNQNNYGNNAKQANYNQHAGSTTHHATHHQTNPAAHHPHQVNYHPTPTAHPSYTSHQNQPSYPSRPSHPTYPSHGSNPVYTPNFSHPSQTTHATISHVEQKPHYYGPSYLGNQPTVISHVGVSQIEDDNIESMFSKIDSTLQSINNELAAPQNIHAPPIYNKATYHPASHQNQPHQNQPHQNRNQHQNYNPTPSYNPAPRHDQYTNYHPQQNPSNPPSYNPNTHHQPSYSGSQHNANSYTNTQNYQISSSQTTQQGGYKKYEPSSSRYKTQRLPTQSETQSDRHTSYESYSNKRQPIINSERNNTNTSTVSSQRYQQPPPQYFKFQPYAPPQKVQPAPVYRAEKSFQKTDYNRDFTSEDVLKLLRTDHRQNIVKIKQYFRNLRRGSDFPLGFDSQNSIVRAASNIDTKSYGKSVSTYDSRPYSTNLAAPNIPTSPTLGGGYGASYAIQSHSSFYS